MCEYFVKADPIQYEQRTRSVRIRGMLTSIRLENMVWDVLAEMAEDEGNTGAKFLTSPRFCVSPVCVTCAVV
jgi:predicted DNA-binding ribbon-helix-helix protein